MATAIYRAYAANDGFVIAADGRESGDPFEVRSDTRQKIFQVGSSAIGYCMKGVTLLGDRRESRLDTILFNLGTEINRQVQSRSAKNAGTLIDYAKTVSRLVYSSLVIACQQEWIDLSNEEKFLTLFMDGYVGGSPSSVKVVFGKENGKPLEPEITSEDPQTGWSVYGSAEVVSRLNQDESYRRKYLRPLPSESMHKSQDLSRFIHDAWTYLRACSGPEALEFDPEVCRSIGGRIHIATITRRDGFSWVPGFEPLS